MAKKKRFNISRYHIIEDFIQSGSEGDLSQEDQEYLRVLYMMNTMRHKYGKYNTIKFFQNEPFSISAYRAKQMFDESINLFYSHESVEKSALRNLKAEQLENAAQAILDTAESSKDMEVYGDLMYKSYKIRQLDRPDPPKIPEGLYKKPIKIYTLTPQNLGMSQDDRNELAREIDALADVPETDKKRVKQEGMIEDIDFIDLLNEQTEED